MFFFLLRMQLTALQSVAKLFLFIRQRLRRYVELFCDSVLRIVLALTRLATNPVVHHLLLGRGSLNFNHSSKFECRD